ncbi:unnamed protein product [Prorocentrum cordatum]|uniref:Uncharacterized protein n=1 Tax=Prorocentrum cordatum TaxID=2364126 RepID=A0ABN9YCH8_9DINO|nr:unnamed protein product [Polarella glacialis]
MTHMPSIMRGRHRAFLIHNVLSCYVCGQVLWEDRAQQGDNVSAQDMQLFQFLLLSRQEATDSCSAFRFAKAAPSACYPRDGGASDSLADTVAVSVRGFDNDQVQRAVSYLGDNASFAHLAADLAFDTNAAYRPTHADDADAADQARFWNEFEDVVTAQLLRRNGALTQDIMSVHPLFAGDTMEQSAQRVRADFPTQFPTEQIMSYLGSMALTMDPEIFGQASCASTVEFVNGPVALGRMIGWAIAEVSPAAFACKWYVGRARPEEVAYNLSQGGLSQAPANVRAMVDGMGLTARESFTAYSEGCPVHPAWPAMHSAASSLSTWLDVVALLTPAQRNEVRLLDYSVAYFRTFAGVHYDSDNRAGLALGQKIVREKLPDYLSEKYGCDAASKAAIRSRVQTKIASLEVLDWATWTPDHWIRPSAYYSSLRRRQVDRVLPKSQSGASLSSTDTTAAIMKPSVALWAGGSHGSPRAAQRKALAGNDGCTEYRFGKAAEGACYPRSGGASDSLRETAAVSVRGFHGNDQVQAAVSHLGANVSFAQVAADLDFDTNVALKPTHADDADAADKSRFWAEFEEVAAAQLLRIQNRRTEEIMSVHPLFDGDTMEQSAQRVRADFPPFFPTEQVMDYLQNMSLTLDPDIFNQPSCTSRVEFVNGPVALGRIIGWAIAEVSPACFACKWAVGRARPEEVAYGVIQGELPDAPMRVKQMMADFVAAKPVNSAEDFTAYTEGCPVHPAWPAMHSAASSLSSWLDVVAILTPAQREEVRLLDFSVAFFRTFAGVHYATDNRAGLALGRKIVESKLPDFLAETYGCDAASASAIRARAAAKIQSFNSDTLSGHPFSWATWTPQKWISPTQFFDASGSAIGDPHMRNMFGQSFDIARTGEHVLINIPQKCGPDDILLRVGAEVRSDRHAHCATDMYIKALNITGAWANKQQTNGFRYLASHRDQHQPWRWFGKVELKVAWGRTRDGEDYLNFYVRHLSTVGHAVGGILGIDDHSEASSPDERCKRSLTLAEYAD